ncbi:unnamed protein product [Larinioides sclopetarius]|uniref:Uncharacterized protein n=1 Tax=Larinioides sclopetarius TaxID=280406 RepID=A0AAV1YU84_9ARAC
MALLKDRPGITLPKGEPQRRKQEKPRLVQRALSQVTSMAFAEAARRRAYSACLPENTESQLHARNLYKIGKTIYLYFFSKHS